MQRFADLIDLVIRRIAGVSLWLVMFLVFLQLFAVILRYLFGVNYTEVQETITILHGLIFMIAAAYVLQIDGYVRVDIFYANCSQRTKNIINMLGALVFLMPISLVILYYSWGYVGESWSILEGSSDSGMQVRYLQKSAILVFAITMGLQGVSILIRNYLSLRVPTNHDI